MVLQAERNSGGYPQQNYSAYQGSKGGYNAYKSVTEYSTPYTSSFQVSSYPLNHGLHHQSGWSSGGDPYGAANHHLGGGTGVPVKPTIGTYESSYYDNSYPHGNSSNHGSPLHQSNGGHENPHGLYNQSHGSSHGQDHGGLDHQGYGSPRKQSHKNPHQHGYGNPPNQGHNNPQHHQGYGSPPKQGHNSPHHQDYGSPHNQGHNSPHQQRLGSPHGDQGHGSLDGFGKTSGFGGGAFTHQIDKPTHGHNNNYGNYGYNPSGFNHGYEKPYWTFKGLDDDE